MFDRYLKSPLLRAIDEYVGWKSERHPLIAGAQKSILYRFAESFELKSVHGIEDKHVAYYIGEQLTGFYSSQALRAIRGFLWYASRAGYDTQISYKMVNETQLRKVGRKTDWEMVKEVKSLKREGKSFDEISRELTERLGRKVYKTSAARWYKKAPLLP